LKGLAAFEASHPLRPALGSDSAAQVALLALVSIETSCKEPIMNKRTGFTLIELLVVIAIIKRRYTWQLKR